MSVGRDPVLSMTGRSLTATSRRLPRRVIVTASSGSGTVQTTPDCAIPPVKSCTREPEPGSNRSIQTNAKVPRCSEPSAARYVPVMTRISFCMRNGCPSPPVARPFRYTSATVPLKSPTELGLAFGPWKLSALGPGAKICPGGGTGITPSNACAAVAAAARRAMAGRIRDTVTRVLLPDRSVVHLHELEDAEAAHAVEEVALDLLDGRQPEHGARQRPHRGVRHRPDDALHHRDEEGSHRQVVETEAEQHDGAERVGSHLAAHADPLSRALRRLHGVVDGLQHGRVQRLVERRHARVVAVDG